VPSRTLLESDFPYLEVSELASEDRRLKDPKRSAHRWWARRPPSLLRAILLAGASAEDLTHAQFWERFASPEQHLKGFLVCDPFMGGGTTLFEAARLGAEVRGGDIDPLAVQIGQHGLSCPSKEYVESVAKQLALELNRRFTDLYPSAGDCTPLHYFFLHQVECPCCRENALLYKDLIIARSLGKTGAVVRDAAVVAFCPECRDVHELDESAVSLTCCGTTWNLDTGTYTKSRFSCPTCGAKSSHAELKTGIADRILIAIEETYFKGRRRIRPPYDTDLAAINRAKVLLAESVNRPPIRHLRSSSHDGRPLNLGIRTTDQLFTSRQALVMGHAFAWMNSQTLDADVKRAVWLALSNSLGANNRLCGYARDYGRLAPLFNIRAYSLPALAVELNPLHPTAGRGTIASCFRRVLRGSTRDVLRVVWRSSVQRKRIAFNHCPGGVDIRARGASDASYEEGKRVHLCVFDPPYFNYIDYDHMSDFYRAWLSEPELASIPLHPSGTDKVESFAAAFAAALSRQVGRLRHDGIFAFTYHSAQNDAWRAVGQALDRADVAVTAAWPVRADPRMGQHAHAGNCEWDLVIVGRHWSKCVRAPSTPHVEHTLANVEARFHLSDADLRNLRLGLQMAAARYAAPAPAEGHRRKHASAGM